MGGRGLRSHHALALQVGGGFDSREDGGDKELVFGLGFSTFIYFLV